MKLDVTLDLDSQECEDGSTYLDRMLAIAGHQLMERLRADTDGPYDSLRNRVREIRDEQIRELVTPIIQEALTGSITRTNTFGEACGTTTLREVIVAEAQKMLQVDRHGYGSRTSPVEEVIRKEILGAFRKELQDSVKQLQADLQKATKEHAAEVIAETVERIRSGR